MKSNPEKEKIIVPIICILDDFIWKCSTVEIEGEFYIILFNEKSKVRGMIKLTSEQKTFFKGT